MQDETSQATMSLMIRSGQITARTLRDAIRQILMKRDVLETRVRDSRTEKQTLRTLVRDGSEMTNIRVSRENIGDFEYIARKYDIRNIRQVLNMSTTDEEMTALLRRTLEDLIMMNEEEFAARRPAGPGDPAGLVDLFYESEEAG